MVTTSRPSSALGTMCDDNQDGVGPWNAPVLQGAWDRRTQLSPHGWSLPQRGHPPVLRIGNTYQHCKWHPWKAKVEMRTSTQQSAINTSYKLRKECSRGVRNLPGTGVQRCNYIVNNSLHPLLVQPLERISLASNYWRHPTQLYNRIFSRISDIQYPSLGVEPISTDIGFSPLGVDIEHPNMSLP